jgi:hypothetical protein
MMKKKATSVTIPPLITIDDIRSSQSKQYPQTSSQKNPNIFVTSDSSKIPANYPVYKLTPYQILGTSPKDTLPVINAAYRSLVMVLHPDKALSVEAKKLGWSNEEKLEAFDQVRSAYKQILMERKESDCPDYNIDYYINEDLLQNGDYEKYMDFQKKTTVNPNQVNSNVNPNQVNTNTNHNQVNSNHNQQHQLNPSGPFDSNKFNEFFTVTQKKHEENGFSDPFARGYNNLFNTSEDTKERERSMIKSSMSRPDIQVSREKPSLEKPDYTNGKLVQYVPKDLDSVGILTHKVSYAELGLNQVNDFSVKLQCKGSICGSDLMAVYGQNNEYWEDSVLRDKDLSSKFLDKTAPEKKMNEHLGQRSNFNFKEIDPAVQRSLMTEELSYQNSEKLRQLHQQKMDNYYNSQSTIKY